MSDGPRIVYESEPSPADIKALGDALTVYNEAKAGPMNYERMFFSVRGADGAFLGGLLGATYWGWCFVSILIVDEACRGTGVGGQLLDRAEALARQRGATHIYLDTFSFQAEPFYARRGYEVFGRLDAFPPGHGRAWMTKPLGAG